MTHTDVSQVIVPPSLVYRVLRQRPLDDHVRRLAHDDHGDDSVMVTPRDPLVSCLQSWLAENRIPMRVRFDENDIAGWIGSFFAWFGGIVKHRWIEPAIEAVEIANTDVRLALFGDWGTGMYGAPLIAKLISGARPTIACHLGDVYYSGTRQETRDRCDAFWPQGATYNRVCNANHDMYSGGDGFFDQVERFQQHASCFAFFNNTWLIVGIDTAYVDSFVTPAQMDWIGALQDRYRGRKLMILSHHQPWSALNTSDDTTAVGRVLRYGVHTWYWGHEHRCVIYNVHPVWRTYGRCLGHGGYPAMRDDVRWMKAVGRGWHAFPAQHTPGGITFDAANTVIGDSYQQHGFMLVELNASEITEHMVTAAGDVVWSSTRRV